MRLLITGAGGQLGTELILYCEKTQIQYIKANSSDFDIADEKATIDFIFSYCPDAVINCAAYNAVDNAETDSERCYKTNALGAANIAKACKKCNAKFVHISTDYVFDGLKNSAYETDDKTNPLSIYGKSKETGERFIQEITSKFFIVRTSWLFSIFRNNFVKTMMQIGQKSPEVKVIDDQIGSPTYAKDLAPLLIALAETDKYGIYHATNDGCCSWYEFAREIMRAGELSCNVIPISTDNYKQQAKRPRNSTLSKEKLDKNGFNRLPSWEDALARCIESME